MSENQYVIGIDGGGTKTVAALADLEGKILRLAKSGPSSPRNVGIKVATKNIVEGIERILSPIRNFKSNALGITLEPKISNGVKKEKILSTFVGLPSVEEEKGYKKKIKKALLKFKKISPIFEGKVKIGSDQIVAYRSGTDEKEGVLLIAGTGSVAHGWSREKEVKVSGWGWLADEGSAFFIGQKVFQAVLKDLDGRGEKTLLTKIVFRELKIRTKEDLLVKIYSQKPIDIIPQFSIYCDKASQKGDLMAKRILLEAGKELATSANTVIKKLTPFFARKRAGFPLVLVGSVFKSKIVLDKVKKEIKKLAPRVIFIRPRVAPVIGAIKLAIEEIR